MAYIINGKELALSLKQEMAANVATFTEKYGRVPHLVVILVGEDPGSVSYVTGKAKASEEVVSRIPLSARMLQSRRLSCLALSTS